MKKLIKSAESVHDTCRQQGNLLHKLSDILVISFCAVICAAQTYRDIELFGKAEELWLSNYLSSKNGIPNADTFERIFEMIDTKILVQKMCWLLESDEVSGKIIAFDGKTARGSKNGEHRAFHTLSAFLTDFQIVSGEIMIDEKSNEITDIPELPDVINVENAIITINAMGAQTKIAEKIIAKKAHYCLSLKGNQSTLHDDVRLHSETETDRFYGRGRFTGLMSVDAVKSMVSVKDKIIEASLKNLRKLAGWDASFLERVLFIK